MKVLPDFVHSLNWTSPKGIGRILLVMALAVGTMAAPLAGNAQQEKKAPKTKKEKQASKGKSVEELKKVLIFPVDTKGGASDQLADIVTAVQQSRLATSGKYSSVLYLSSLPTIKRAISEQVLTPADTSAPFDSEAKIKRLAQMAGYKYVLSSSIDDYQFDAEKQQVNLVMTIRLIDYTGDKPVIRTAGEGISTKEKAVKDEKDIAPVIDMARNLTEKLMKEILTPKSAEAEKK